MDISATSNKVAGYTIKKSLAGNSSSASWRAHINNQKLGVGGNTAGGLRPRRVFGPNSKLGTVSILCAEFKFTLSVQFCGKVSYSSTESKDVK